MHDRQTQFNLGLCSSRYKKREAYDPEVSFIAQNNKGYVYFNSDLLQQSA